MECTFPRHLWNKSENRKVKVKSNNLFRPKDACINNIPGRKSNHAKCKSTWCSWTQRMSEIKQNLKLIGFLWPRSALFNQCGRWDGKLLEKRWVWSQPGGVDEVDDQRGDGKNKDQADLKKDMINCAKSETQLFWYLAPMEAIISARGRGFNNSSALAVQYRRNHQQKEILQKTLGRAPSYCSIHVWHRDRAKDWKTIFPNSSALVNLPADKRT